MKRFLLCCLLWMLSPVLPAAPTLLVVGDSLSAGYGVSTEQRWVTLLTKRLHSRCGEVSVVNASISGDTSSGGVARLPSLLKQHRPALVIIELGGNDGLRGISPRTLSANLLEMVRTVQSEGARVLLLGVRLPANYGVDFVNAFHQVYYDVAKAASVPLVPFFLEGVALDTTLMQADGIHPNDRAQPRLLENVWSHLQPLLDDPGSGITCHQPARSGVSSAKALQSDGKQECPRIQGNFTLPLFRREIIGIIPGSYGGRYRSPRNVKL